MVAQGVDLKVIGLGLVVWGVGKALQGRGVQAVTMPSLSPEPRVPPPGVPRTSGHQLWGSWVGLFSDAELIARSSSPLVSQGLL